MGKEGKSAVRTSRPVSSKREHKKESKKNMTAPVIHHTRRPPAPRRHHTKKTRKTNLPRASSSLDKQLVENMVLLQKVHTELVVKFDSLSKEISSLLKLFEVTARNLARNAPATEYEKDKQFLEKIDRLLEQNKTIAKGLVMMESRMKEKVYGAPQQPREEQFQRIVPNPNRPLPRF